MKKKILSINILPFTQRKVLSSRCLCPWNISFVYSAISYFLYVKKAWIYSIFVYHIIPPVWCVEQWNDHFSHKNTIYNSWLRLPKSTKLAKFCIFALDSNTKFLAFVCMYVCVYIYIYIYIGGACGVMVIVIGNGHSDASSNPGRDRLHFT